MLPKLQNAILWKFIGAPNVDVSPFITSAKHRLTLHAYYDLLTLSCHELENTSESRRKTYNFDVWANEGTECFSSDAYSTIFNYRAHGIFLIEMQWHNSVQLFDASIYECFRLHWNGISWCQDIHETNAVRVLISMIDNH